MNSKMILSAAVLVCGLGSLTRSQAQGPAADAVAVLGTQETAPFGDQEFLAAAGDLDAEILAVRKRIAHFKTKLGFIEAAQKEVADPAKGLASPALAIYVIADSTTNTNTASMRELIAARTAKDLPRVKKALDARADAIKKEIADKEAELAKLMAQKQMPTAFGILDLLPELGAL